MKKLTLLGCFLFLVWFATGTLFQAGDYGMTSVGEAHAHGQMTQESVARYREELLANFHSTGALFEPARRGEFAPREMRSAPGHFRPAPVRTADECFSCHYLPFAGEMREANGG